MTAQEEMQLELTGVVTSIKMVVSNPNTAENNKNIVTEDLNTPGDIKGYYVTMKDIRIQTLADSDRETFKIVFGKFCYGTMDVVLQFSGIHLPFEATYVGEMPLYSLLDVVDYLNHGDNYENTTSIKRAVQWCDEPGSLNFDFIRNLENDSLSINMKYGNDSSWECSLVQRKWTILLPYLQFRKEVICAALNCLKTYGLHGCYENWMDERNDFPLATLIRSIADKKNIDHPFGEYQSDISLDLKILIDALNAN